MSAAPARADGVHGFAAVALAPDGAHVAALETQGDDPARALVIRDTIDDRARIVALPCAGADCVPGAPAWSPDGARVAFALRGSAGHARTIYSVAADGTDLRLLATFDGTVVTLRYARDGRLAALAVADADREVGASEPGAAPGGAVHEQRIAIIDAGALRFASPAGLNVYEYDWRPDGTGFVATASAGNGDAHWWTARLYAFGTQGEKGRVVFAPTDRQMQLAQPRISPDGGTVAFIGGLMSDFDNPGGDVYAVPLSGAAAPRNLTSGVVATATSIAWRCGGGALLAGLDIAGETALADIAPDGTFVHMLWRDARQLTTSDGAVAQACASSGPAPALTAAVAESFTVAPEIVVGAIGAWRTLTHTNADAAAPVTVKNLRWSENGRPGQAWLLLPVGDAPASGKRPLIVVPHGGPAWAYVPSFQGSGFLRALIDAGFALLLPNPRGSYGQGEAFVRANAGDFGGGDFRDIMAGVDAAIHVAPIDPDRLGIEGVSYGGFMTMWAVTRTTRFRAAVARAGISNWQSYYGQNGIGDWLIPYFGASLYDDPQIYARTSPIFSVQNVRTPTLMLVGERDIECPPAQTAEFAHALAELGVPSAAIVYPGEGHAIRDPAHAADARARTVAWFRRWLD